MGETVDDQPDELLSPSSEEFRRCLGHFATGVTIITAIDGGEPVGVVANSFTSVSLDPPLVLFCVAHTSGTWPRLQRAGRFAVNILGDHQEDLSRVFAGPGDRFADVEWYRSRAGSPVLPSVLAYVDCEPWAEYAGGDHTIVVGRVLDVGITHDAGPLLFFRGRYGRLVADQG